jgi:hypothetical protein
LDAEPSIIKSICPDKLILRRYSGNIALSQSLDSITAKNDFATKSFLPVIEFILFLFQSILSGSMSTEKRPGLLDEVRQGMRLHHDSILTERTYCVCVGPEIRAFPQHDLPQRSERRGRKDRKISFPFGLNGHERQGRRRERLVMMATVYHISALEVELLLGCHTL